MAVKSFKELNTYLERFVPGSILDGDFYNPQKMYKLLPLVGSPEKKFKSIHVAGTSGKTSTCYYISSLLGLSGAKVGLSVSPHVFQINERVQINNVPLNEQKFCKLFSEFIKTPALVDLQPTYFELLVVFSFWVFAREGCTHAVIEVGLGGLKDATNVIADPDKIAVITDIGFDHTHILGDTIEKIAAQKAGIIKPGNNVFCYEQGEVVNTVIDRQVQETGAELHRLNQSDLEKNSELTEGLPRYQKRNWLLAKAVNDFVRQRDNLKILSKNQIQQSQELIVPARLQKITANQKLVLLDGAHNPQKLTALTTSINALYSDRNIKLLVAFAGSKQATVEESLKILHEISEDITLTEFFMSEDLPHKAIDVSELKTLAKKTGFKEITVQNNQAAAFEQAIKKAEDILLVTGSFYLIGSLYNELKGLMQ